VDEGVWGDEGTAFRHAADSVLSFVADFGDDEGSPAAGAVRVLAVEGEGTESWIVVKADGAEEVLNRLGRLEWLGNGEGGSRG